MKRGRFSRVSGGKGSPVENGKGSILENPVQGKDGFVAVHHRRYRDSRKKMEPGIGVPLRQGDLSGWGMLQRDPSVGHSRHMGRQGHHQKVPVVKASEKSDGSLLFLPSGGEGAIAALQKEGRVVLSEV